VPSVVVLARVVGARVGVVGARARALFVTTF
jgi:hypothetical protein